MFGYPGKKLYKCLPHSEFPEKIDHCVAGSLLATSGPNRLMCQLCEDGYRVDSKLKCLKNPEGKDDGCWYGGDEVCVGCKAFQGWFSHGIDDSNLNQICKKGE